MPVTRKRQPAKIARRSATAASPLPSVVNVHEAKTQLSRLLARVAAGEEITIARAGEPFARLVPLAARGPRVPGRFKGQFGPLPDSLFFDSLPESELAQWEGGLTHPADPLGTRP